MSEEKIIIIGAGPAGLTSAYKLAERGREPTVLESRGQVGGIACTENYKGFHFDMGGHRFFSQHSEPYSVWNAVLDEDFLVRGRLSRIYYKGKFFDYPLRTMNALKGIGPIGVWWVLQSYVWRRFFPLPQEDNFEQWVTNRFGRRLFLTFFKS
ncbi:MAG: FAD-dependent oxidoreductase [Planctomycetota bacterium]|jgi:protoporphyrinogen oxidase